MVFVQVDCFCFLCLHEKLRLYRLVLFLLNVFGVGVSCRNVYSFVVYLYVNISGSITSVGEERANLSAVFTSNYVVSVWRGFLFLWVLGMDYVILLWHSLSLPLIILLTLCDIIRESVLGGWKVTSHFFSPVVNLHCYILYK